MEQHPRQAAEAAALQGGEEADIRLLLRVLQAHGGSTPGAPVFGAIQARSPGTPLIDPEMRHAKRFPRPLRASLSTAAVLLDKKVVEGAMAKCWHYLDGAHSAQTLPGVF
jgi:hypothetical protein